MRLNPIFKSLFLVLLFVLACFTVQSCLKESVPNGKETYEKENTVAYREGLNCPQIKSSVYQSEGKLVFSDYQHFYDCIECLEQDVEVYNDAYENQYPTATAEELDILDSINNFKEWQPLADFETSKSFTSLRSIVEQQSQVWLNAQYGETINFDNDPDELCPIIDEETRTLFNVDGYIKIGNEVVSMQDWADEAETALWDCCAFYRSSKYTFDYADDPYLLNRQIRAKISIRSALANSVLKAKIKHYRKVGGSYKKRRANMKLNIAGVAFDGECNSTIQGWSAFKGYKKRKVRRIKDHIFSLWREALVCRTDPRFPTNRCGLGFFVDSDIHGYGLFLAK